MSTRLIKLDDGTLVEVEATGDTIQQISGSLAEKVDTTFSRIKPLLIKACRPVLEAVKDMRDEVELEQVEVELGLSFEGEGNLYITKARLGANILVRMTLKNR